jgi:uncharacterized protein
MLPKRIQAALLAAMALCLAHPATPAKAEVLLTRESGGDFSVGVMSWWEIPFRTVVRQPPSQRC